MRISRLQYTSILKILNNVNWSKQDVLVQELKRLLPKVSIDTNLENTLLVNNIPFYSEVEFREYLKEQKEVDSESCNHIVELIADDKYIEISIQKINSLVGFKAASKFGNCVKINNKEFYSKRNLIDYLRSTYNLENIKSNNVNCKSIQEGHAILLDNIAYIADSYKSYSINELEGLYIAGYMYAGEVIWKYINEDMLQIKEVSNKSYVSILNNVDNSTQAFYPLGLDDDGRLLTSILGG